MRRKEGERAKIPSSGFSLKPLVKVNERCVQSAETDYITAPLINSVSMRLPPARARELQCLRCLYNWMYFISAWLACIDTMRSPLFTRVFHSAPLSVYQHGTRPNSRGKVDDEGEAESSVFWRARWGAVWLPTCSTCNTWGMCRVLHNCLNGKVMLSKTEWCRVLPLACWVCTIVLTHIPKRKQRALSHKSLKLKFMVSC